MTTIAVVAMGQMGSAIARRLVERGARVVTSVAGRTAASADRAKAAGAEIVDDASLVENAELFLSVVPPSAAGETAQRFLQLVRNADRKPVFIDCNAIAPQTLHTISGPFLAEGLPFIDASIIGIPPKSEGSSPRLYMSGLMSDEAELLKRFGLDTRVLSDALGDASALKMSYAGITKGFQALGTSLALGAARNGAAESFLSELSESQPALYGWLKKQLPTMYAKAYRWDGEMNEIAKFLQPDTGAVGMLEGAASVYRTVAQANSQGPESEILSTLAQFVRGAERAD